MDWFIYVRNSTINFNEFKVFVFYRFPILDFYNVKSHLFVKFANLATTINKFLFYFYIFFIIDI